MHHAEGSVFVHSKLVASLLPDETDFQIAALFHDMGKIDTTIYSEHKNGGIKISSNGHETLVDNYIAHYRNCFENVNWERVRALCFNHMKAHLYLDGSMSNKNKRKLFEELPYFKDIIVFAKADNDGRMTENGLPILVITIGIPGSGKSTWRKKFCKKSQYEYVCPDEIREEITGSVSDQSRNKEVWDIAYSRLNQYILENKNVVFDSTACNISTINKLQEHSKNAILCFKIFKEDAQVCKNRIKSDIEHKINRSNVPSEIIDRMNTNLYEVLNYIDSKLIIT